MQLYCSGAIKEPDYKSCDLVCQRRWNLVPDVEFRYRPQPHRLRALGPSVCSRVVAAPSHPVMIQEDHLMAESPRRRFERCALVLALAAVLGAATVFG